MGLCKEEELYVPSSALLEDIKKLTDAPSQVLAILEYESEEKVYSVVRHVAKGLNLHNLKLPEEIKAKISLEQYKCRENAPE